MASITLIYAVEDGERIQTAMCAIYDYEQNKNEGETEAQFTKRMVIKLLKDTVKQHEQRVAIENANNGITGVDIS